MNTFNKKYMVMVLAFMMLASCKKKVATLPEVIDQSIGNYKGPYTYFNGTDYQFVKNVTLNVTNYSDSAIIVSCSDSAIFFKTPLYFTGDLASGKYEFVGLYPGAEMATVSNNYKNIEFRFTGSHTQYKIVAVKN